MARANSVLFSITDGIDYEISPYVTTMNDDIIYGKRIPIKNDDNIKRILTKIYNECNGINWEHQENWCTDVPVTDWEGISYNELNDFYHFDFISKNSISGTIKIENCEENIYLYGTHSDLPINMTINNCHNSNIVILECNLNELVCNDWKYSGLEIYDSSISKLHCNNLYGRNYDNLREHVKIPISIIKSQINSCTLSCEAMPIPDEPYFYYGNEGIEIGDSEIDELIMDNYDYFLYFIGEGQIFSNKIRSLNISNGSLDIDKESLKHIEYFYLDGGTSYFNIYDKANFDNNGTFGKNLNTFSLQMIPQIKSFHFSGPGRPNEEFYSNLESIDLRKAPPSLKEFTFNCSISHEDNPPKTMVYFDESMNNINLSLHGNIFHQMLPECYIDRYDNGNNPEGYFSYDDKYIYHYINDERLLKETRNYGWWYPDEPW